MVRAIFVYHGRSCFSWKTIRHDRGILARGNDFKNFSVGHDYHNYRYYSIFINCLLSSFLLIFMMDMRQFVIKVRDSDQEVMHLNDRLLGF